MKVSILDAGHIIFDGAVSEAVLPGVGGEVTILDDHEMIFLALGKGSICLKRSVRKMESSSGFREKSGSLMGIKPIVIHQGLARMKNNELVILVE